MPTYKETPIFQGFLIDNNDKKSEDPIPINNKNSTLVIKNTSHPTLLLSLAATMFEAGLIVKLTTKVKEIYSKKILSKLIEIEETCTLIIKLV